MRNTPGAEEEEDEADDSIARTTVTEDSAAETSFVLARAR